MNVFSPVPHIQGLGKGKSKVSSGADGRQHLLWAALNHLNSALDLLDRASAPAQIGARVDGAIHEVESLVAASGEAKVSSSRQAKPN